MHSEFEKKFIELLRKPVKSKQELQEMEHVRIEFVKELNTETKELLDQLNAAGLSVTSVWDLVNTNNPYPEAVNILINHVHKEYHPRNKEGIVRALAVKEARGKASSVLIDEYDKIPKDNKSLRWAIGNTVFTTITKEDTESILPIVQNKENGKSRQMFVAALGKLRSEKAEDALIGLLNDDEVATEALHALGLLRSKKAKEKITLMKNHSDALIRKEALAALKRIG